VYVDTNVSNTSFVSFFRAEDCSVTNETKIVRNRSVQFRVTTMLTIVLCKSV
jgi:hypothetical protein